MKEYIRQFFRDLCFVYTVVSVAGAAVNLLAGSETSNTNVLVMFGVCAIATFVLSLHRLLTDFSPLAMILLQYAAACVLIGVLLLLVSTFGEPVSRQGWFEYYRSFTIPYVLLAGLYYARVFSETRRQDRLIHELQEQRSQIKL